MEQAFVQNLQTEITALSDEKNEIRSRHVPDIT